MLAASALASWDVPFPGHHVRIFWKAVSIASAIMPLAISVLAWIDALLFPTNDSDALDKCIEIVMILHCLVRLVLIALIFYSFKNLPSRVYDTQDWLDFLPFFH